MTLIKKTTASVALVALTSGLFVNGVSAYSNSELEAANKLAAAGIINTHTNAEGYQLSQPIKRQEIAWTIRGLAGLPKATTCDNMFKDVSAKKPNTWACLSVEPLAKAGKITTENKNFRPEANISKAEAVAMVVKAVYGDEYKREAGKAWEKQVVDFAVSKGIVSSFSNYTTPATRGWIFEMAAKTMNNSSEDEVSKILNSLIKDDKETTKKEDNNSKAEMRKEGTLKVSMSPQSPSNGAVVANSDRAVLLAFDVNAGNTDVTLKKASLKFTGTGDFNIVKNLAIYANDVKITKGDEKTFNSRLTTDLSFDRNIVVKAGETKTLFVTATIDPKDSATYNQMIRIALTNLEASSSVSGAELVGATLTPYLVSNRGEVTVDTSSASGRLYIGQEGILYNFSVRETNKREDIIVKSVTFAEGEGNNVDLDNLSDLVLLANNSPVKANFTYSKGKIVAALNETVKAGQKVNFTLKGKPTDDLNKKFELVLDNVYSVGATTAISAKSSYTTKNKVSKTVEGTAINFTFNREGTNEVSANTTNVKIGELVFTTTSDYTASLKVTVSGNTKNSDKATYENVELGNTSANNSDKVNNVYTFTEVNLNKGTTKLPLTVDVTEFAVDTNKLKFTVDIVKLEEETVGEKVDALNKVLNNNSLSRDVTVRTAGFKLTAERANITKVVPKGNQEVVLYKGKIDLSGSENIVLDNLVFDKVGNLDLVDYISGVTLSVGGRTYLGDVNSNNIDFSSIQAEIQKSAKNVEVLLTARLKDKELTAVQTLEVVPSKVSVSSDNTKNLKGVITSTNYSGVSANSSTKVNLVGNTEFQVVSVDNKAKREIVAGEKNAEVGSFKVKETSADVFFNSFKIKVESSDINAVSSAFNNLKLVDGNNEIATGGRVDGEYVVFENFTLPQSGKDRVIKIVTDLASLRTSGGQAQAYLGSVAFKDIVVDTTEATVVGTLAANSQPVKIVPAKVTFDVTKMLNNDGNSQAIVRFTVSAGDNEISRLNIKDLMFNKSITVSSIKVDGKSVVSTQTSNETFTLNEEVPTNKTFDVEILVDTAVNNVALNKVTLDAITSDGKTTTFESDVTNVTLGSFK